MSEPTDSLLGEARGFHTRFDARLLRTSMDASDGDDPSSIREALPTVAEFLALRDAADVARRSRAAVERGSRTPSTA